MRENCGEIEAAAQHTLPHLIELGDLRGDLQMHTTATDGKHSIEAMAAAARALGYEYIAITDHSKALAFANGMDEARTLEQARKIRSANERDPGIRLLAGIEVDVLKDGRLDLPDDVLAELDIVVVSVHSFMGLEHSAMTERMLAAIENPYTQIIGHPTGRLLLRRDAFAYDMERILDAARRHGVAMECNAAPDRLDLKDVYLRMAKDRGVRVVISTDAHSTRGLDLMRYGVHMARRGWIEKKDVLNALPLPEMLAALRPRPGEAGGKAGQRLIPAQEFFCRLRAAMMPWRTAFCGSGPGRKLRFLFPRCNSGPFSSSYWTLPAREFSPACSSWRLPRSLSSLYGCGLCLEPV